MSRFQADPQGDLTVKLKWLMFARVLFTSLLLGSTIIFHLEEGSSPFSTPILFLYSLIAGVFVLSVLYAVVLGFVRRPGLFAWIQVCIDTVIVSMIIFVTGSYSSIFSFLYLVVIIYASMLLPRHAAMLLAGLCSLEYALLILLEYYGVVLPMGIYRFNAFTIHSFDRLIYKVVMTSAGCFSVAYLASLLAEQARKTKRELLAMEEHVKRVEKMAAIGEMAAGMAHEIKNPLASLSGSIQMLREEIPQNAANTVLMNIILREADRLSSLVNDFLLFAKPPEGNRRPMSLDRALIEILALFRQECSDRTGVSLQTQIAENVWVAMDPMHLRQVMWNLLLNAREAIAESGVIHVWMRPEKNRTARVWVEDDGCGIPEENYRQVFDPFFTTKPTGTGLGLSIVLRIIQSYGSRLDVQSAVGRGTAFTFSISMVDPPEGAS